MENEYGIGTILNSYTYTLPTGNTISVTAPNDFLASLKAEDQFRKFKAQGNFTNLTEADLGTPSAQRADAEAYITAGLDIPEGTKITQNMREVADSLTQKGYIVENDTITKVPPSADPEVKSAFVKKLQEHIVGLKEIPTDQLSIYDINGDGSIGTGDVVNALRGFKNLGQTEEINNKITSAFSNFIENSPELSSKAMVERIQEDIVGLDKIPADEIDQYDFNNDGSITIQDTTAALRHDQGLETNEKVANALDDFHTKNMGLDTTTISGPDPDPDPDPVVSDSANVGANVDVDTGTESNIEPVVLNTGPSTTPLQTQQPIINPQMSVAQPTTSTAPQVTPVNINPIPTQQATTTQVQGFQPQFMGNVNPATGTFVLGQQPTYTPLSTGVLGQSSVGPQTISLNNPNYGGSYFMQQGGMVPNMQQQQQQTMPMTQSFGGFKPQAMQRIAGSLGYQGDMSGFNDYLNNNPDKKQKMDMYTQKAMQMAQGGMAQKFQVGGTPRVLDQQYIPSQTFTEGSTLTDVLKTQAITPGLPSGAIVTPIGVGVEAGQFIDPASGQVSGSAALPTALATTTQAGMPVATPTTVMTAQTAATDVDKVAAGTRAAQADAPETITAEQQAESSITGLQAAQGTATLIDNPVTREIQSGELVTGAADAEKAAKFTEQVQAAEATPSKKATVQGQLEGLMDQFEGGATPAWAAGAMRAVSAQMAARGLGASSIAGQALVQAAMESALPIAQADASTQATFEQQNLSNRQQRAMLAAQQRAQFIGQEFDQAFQARVANAAKVSDVANMNFTAEQQIALENSRIANSMNLANLNNNQAMVMAEAAALANLDMANLSNRQQAAVQNAQNFLQIDMANLSNQQQTELFRAQQRTQALFTDQAAINAAAQFNATSQNQTDQFFASLANNTAQFNTSQANAQAQFNAGQTNVIERFNTEINNQRQQFNAQNRLVIDQANAQWRRQIATADNQAINRANEINAASLLGYSTTAYNNLWQFYSDNMNWAWTSAENDRGRYQELALAQLNADTTVDLAKLKEDFAVSEGFGALIGALLTSDLKTSIGSSILGSFI
tara:strand:+ start:582 stop:3797 length:3216 start_codon:yes stop_codon:yes gene_type:complete